MDVGSSREMSDIAGTTDHFNGTVGTTTKKIPSVAGDHIHEAFIESRSIPSTKKLFVSFDGGTTFKTIDGGGNFAWAPKGGITQIDIKASAAGHEYEIILNRSDEVG